MLGPAPGRPAQWHAQCACVRMHPRRPLAGPCPRPPCARRARRRRARTGRAAARRPAPPPPSTRAAARERGTDPPLSTMPGARARAQFTRSVYRDGASADRGRYNGLCARWGAGRERASRRQRPAGERARRGGGASEKATGSGGNLARRSPPGCPYCLQKPCVRIVQHETARLNFARRVADCARLGGPAAGRWPTRPKSPPLRSRSTRASAPARPRCPTGCGRPRRRRTAAWPPPSPTARSTRAPRTRPARRAWSPWRRRATASPRR